MNELKILVLAAGVSGVIATPLSRAETVSATPSRPSVSSSAQLSAPGHFEIESGIQRTKGSDGVTRASFPSRLKYSFSENAGLLLDHELGVRQKETGAILDGTGDTALTLKLKMPEEISSLAALGLEMGFIAPTAKKGLGLSKPAYVVNGIASFDWRGLSTDVNLGAVHVRSAPSDEGRTGWAWAVSGTHGLNEKWDLTAEMSGTGRRGVATQTQVLGALAYKVSSRIVVDLGFAGGVSHAAPDWSAFSGMTVLFDKI